MRLRTILPLLLTLLAVGVILVLAVRGLPGNPSIASLKTSAWSWDGPLELSPERGRVTLLYSLIENHSLHFTPEVARLAIPDLAILPTGEYVSLFSPGPSFLAVPGYLLGKHFGASIFGAYLTSAFFAFLNFWLIRSIAQRLGARSLGATLGALTFLFATPAFAYAANLYQHHMSVFLLLVSFWALLRFQGVLSLGIVWVACSLSVVIDNPNVFLMFPLGIFSLGRLWAVLSTARAGKPLVVSSLQVLAALVFFVLPVVFLGWYNLKANGSPFQLPGTLRSVVDIGDDGKPRASTYEAQVLTAEQRAQAHQSGNTEKSAVGFFETRNLYNGFYIHLLSPDRGVLAYAPVVLIGFFGFVVLYRRRAPLLPLLVASLGVNILLYSMWGDPWGGWAFGSRYLIPSYAILSIGIGVALTSVVWQRLILLAFLPLFLYSAGVNSLGAITTSTNPPKVQVLSLEKQSGHEEKYTFLRNWEYLNGKYQSVGVKAFVYQAWAKQWMTPRLYFILLVSLVDLVALTYWGVLAWATFKPKSA